MNKEDLSEDNFFLLTIFHYNFSGEKHRFCLPRLVKGDQVLAEIRHLQKTHNIFRFKFHYSNFEHTPQIFSEVLATHAGWRERLDAYENRVPYLTSSLASPEEIEVFCV
jgi:hypothetical protein